MSRQFRKWSLTRAVPWLLLNSAVLLCGAIGSVLGGIAVLTNTAPVPISLLLVITGLALMAGGSLANASVFVNVPRVELASRACCGVGTITSVLCAMEIGTNQLLMRVVLASLFYWIVTFVVYPRP